MSNKEVQQYSPATGVGERTEYGLRLDCAKEGCDPVHGDNGYISSFYEGYGEPDPQRNYTVSGHATTLVTRVVVLPEWDFLQ